jgi:transposase
VKTEQLKAKVSSLLQLGKSERSVAAALNISRRKVSLLKNEVVLPPLAPGSTKTKLDHYQAEIVQWLDGDKLSCRLIFEKLLKIGVAVSYETVTRFVNKLKNQEVYVPLITAPGEEGQVDFGFLGEFEKNGEKVKVWVFSMILSFSRYAYYKIVTDQTIPTFLKCHLDAFQFFKGVPATVKLDNLKAGILQANLFEPLPQPQYEAFLKYYGSVAIACRPYRPQDKGKVEAAVKYVKQNFLKSIAHRDYKRLLNELAEWNIHYCNQRIHGVTKKIPAEQFLKYEKQQLLALPGVPYRFLVREERKVSAYGHVLFKENFYSTPYQFAGLTVYLESNGVQLKIFFHFDQIALHQVAVHDKGMFITNEFHKPPAKQTKSADEFLERMHTIGPSAAALLLRLQAERPRHWHAMARGIIALTNSYTNRIIDASCKSALSLGLHNYISIKRICQEGMEDKPHHEAVSRDGEFFDDLSIYDRLTNKSKPSID